MTFEYYFDSKIGMTHIEKHGVSQEEIEVFFEDHDYIKRKRPDGSLTAMTKLESGRYLKVVYRQKAEFYFIITAYDLENTKEIHMVDDFLEDL